MKSFVRWNTIIGLVSGAIVGSSLLGAVKAFALPQELILKKLQNVPVFMLVDSKTHPLTSKDSTGVLSTGVFISQGRAQVFLAQARNHDPEVVKDVRVFPVALSDVYKMDQSEQNKTDPLVYTYVAEEQQINHATKLLNTPSFSGVPIFYAEVKAGELLTMQINNEQVIPVFFDYEQLEELLAQQKKQRPDLASAEIRVTDLTSFLQAMQTKDDPKLRQMILVPTRESLDYLRSLRPINTPSTPSSSGNK